MAGRSLLNSISLQTMILMNPADNEQVRLWRRQMIRYILLPLFLFTLTISAFGGAPQVVDLKCDYRTTPLAVDHSDPLLSWRLEGDRRGLAQSAYQIHTAFAEATENTCAATTGSISSTSQWTRKRRPTSFQPISRLPKACMASWKNGPPHFRRRDSGHGNRKE